MQAVSECFKLAKDSGTSCRRCQLSALSNDRPLDVSWCAGFKIIAHMMPDLPNMGMERDIEQFKVSETSVPRAMLLSEPRQLILPLFGVALCVWPLQEYFSNPQFRTDGLKIYPTLVIRGTGTNTHEFPYGLHHAKPCCSCEPLRCMCVWVCCAGLYELWKTGAYKNYSPDALIDLLAKVCRFCFALHPVVPQGSPSLVLI